MLLRVPEVLNQVIPIYLSSLTFFYVSVCHVIWPHFIGRYFSAYNAIDNHNKMRQYDLEIDKYWVTQSEYFRLLTTVALGMGITDRDTLLCHGISEGIVDKKFSIREYNNRMFYECFNNPFPDNFFSPALNLPPISIYGIP